MGASAVESLLRVGLKGKGGERDEGNYEPTLPVANGFVVFRQQEHLIAAGPPGGQKNRRVGHSGGSIASQNPPFHRPGALGAHSHGEVFPFVLYDAFASTGKTVSLVLGLNEDGAGSYLVETKAAAPIGRCLCREGKYPLGFQKDLRPRNRLPASIQEDALHSPSSFEREVGDNPFALPAQPSVPFSLPARGRIEGFEEKTACRDQVNPESAVLIGHRVSQGEGSVELIGILLVGENHLGVGDNPTPVGGEDTTLHGSGSL